MDSPGSRPCGGARVAPPADGLVLYRSARSSQRSVQSSESNELPASQPASPKPAGCPEKEQTRRSKYRAPSVGIGCSDGICESTTRACIRGYDAEDTPARTARLKKPKHIPLSWIGGTTSRTPMSIVWRTMSRSRVGAGFKLDQWGRFHDLEGNETDLAYQCVATLRKHYGQYQGPGEGEPLGTPSTIRLPHTKGTTPDRDTTPTESELAGSDHGDSGQEEGEVTQAEGDEPVSFTQMKSRDMDSGSKDTTPGRDSWRRARGRETVMLTTPRPRGRGKRRMERGGGSTKRPRMESSSSERRDASRESRSGGARDRPGRGGRRAARPLMPPHRPPPPSTSPRRSPRLSQSSAARDLRNLPLSAKTDRRTAHSRLVNGDEHGLGPSRSPRSSSDHGRSGQGQRSRSREPTPPQLMNFSIDDFTVVSHTTDSFTFTSTTLSFQDGCELPWERNPRPI